MSKIPTKITFFSNNDKFTDCKLVDSSNSSMMKRWKPDYKYASEVANKFFTDVELVGSIRNWGSSSDKMIIKIDGKTFETDFDHSLITKIIHAGGIEKGGKLNAPLSLIWTGAAMNLVYFGSEEYKKGVQEKKKDKTKIIPFSKMTKGYVYTSKSGEDVLYCGKGSYLNFDYSYYDGAIIESEKKTGNILYVIGYSYSSSTSTTDVLKSIRNSYNEHYINTNGFYTSYYSDVFKTKSASTYRYMNNAYSKFSDKDISLKAYRENMFDLLCDDDRYRVFAHRVHASSSTYAKLWNMGSTDEEYAKMVNHFFHMLPFEEGEKIEIPRKVYDCLSKRISKMNSKNLVLNEILKYVAN